MAWVGENWVCKVCCYNLTAVPLFSSRKGLEMAWPAHCSAVFWVLVSGSEYSPSFCGRAEPKKLTRRNRWSG